MRNMKTYSARIKAALAASGKTQTELADHVGVKQQTIQYLCSRGKGSRHNQSIASFLNVNPVWLERGVGQMKPDGFSNVQKEELIGMAPLVSWVQAGEFCEIEDNFHPGDAEDWYPRPKGAGPRTYALRVNGDSMSSPYPKDRTYPHGTIIFVDPDQETLPGSRGIFKTADSSTATFKELIEDAGNLYLRPLNPQYDKISVTDDMITCGKVIGSFLPE